MLASGAITSTAGVITSFSCIRYLLLHPVPWTRVLTSRVATPHTPPRRCSRRDAHSPTRAPCPRSPQVSCHLGAGGLAQELEAAPGCARDRWPTHAQPLRGARKEQN